MTPGCHQCALNFAPMALVCHRSNPFAKCDRCEKDQAACSLNMPPPSSPRKRSSRKTSSISSLRSSLGRKRSAMFSDSDRGSEGLVNDASSTLSALDGMFLPPKASLPLTESSQTSSNPGRPPPPSLSYHRCRPRHSRKPPTPCANSMKSKKLILV